MPKVSKRIGERRLLIKHITQHLIDEYARIGGDKNPIHVEPNSPKSEKVIRALSLSGTIAHGIFAVDTLAGEMLYEFGGPNCVFHSKGAVKYIRPVPVGTTVYLEGEIVAATHGGDPGNWRYTVRITFRKEGGEEYATPLEAVLKVFEEER